MRSRFRGEGDREEKGPGLKDEGVKSMCLGRNCVFSLHRVCYVAVLW